MLFFSEISLKIQKKEITLQQNQKTITMEKLLVPVDFSAKSEEALDVAVQLAKKNNSKIYLLHCVELPVRYTTRSTSELPEALYFIKLAQQNIHETAEKLAHQGLSVVPILETISLADSVENIIKREGIDFVIMGSTGASGAKEVFIGSNAEKVVRSSQVPVLVIKAKTKIDQIKKIVFACDFSQKYENAFEKAVVLARLLRAKIDFVYINTPYAFRTTREIKQLMDDFAHKHREIRSHNIHTYDDFRIEEGIMNFAQDHDSDLICMFPVRRSGIAHFFNGSISEDIVNHSDKPVLTIKI